MKIQKTSFTTFLLLFLIASAHTQSTDKKCCQAYDPLGTVCKTCPPGTYYSGNNCIIDIDNCVTYEDCFSCSACSPGFKLVDTQVNNLKTKKCQ